LPGLSEKKEYPKNFFQRIIPAQLSSLVEVLSMAVADEPTEAADPQASMSEVEALIQEHRRLVFSICYRMTGCVQDAEDLSQETFVQAFRNYAQFRGESQASAWLRRIAINQCLNWKARRNRVESLHQSFAENLEAAGENSEDAECSQAVHEALMKLKPAHRAAVVLTTYEGLSHAEAATVLGCSETTVSWRLFVARRQLKKSLRHLSRRNA
jgi:RNA polymerase sigma-70 factor (ECF subfamily)